MSKASPSALLSRAASLSISSHFIICYIFLIIYLDNKSNFNRLTIFLFIEDFIKSRIQHILVWRFWISWKFLFKLRHRPSQTRAKDTAVHWNANHLECSWILYIKYVLAICQYLNNTYRNSRLFQMNY